LIFHILLNKTTKRC